MKRTKISNKTMGTVNAVVEAFSDAPFPYASTDVTDEGLQHLEMLEEIFHIYAKTSSFINIKDVMLYRPIIEIYSDPYEMSPQECLYALPRLLVLIIQLQSSIHDYTAEVLNFLNFSPQAASRKQAALINAGYDPSTFQHNFVMLSGQCFVLFQKHHCAAVLQWLFLVQEWSYDNGFYQQDDMDIAISHWQMLSETGVATYLASHHEIL